MVVHAPVGIEPGADAMIVCLKEFAARRAGRTPLGPPATLSVAVPLASRAHTARARWWTLNPRGQRSRVNGPCISSWSWVRRVTQLAGNTHKE